jgi:hypothetical protein
MKTITRCIDNPQSERQAAGSLTQMTMPSPTGILSLCAAEIKRVRPSAADPNVRYGPT